MTKLREIEQQSNHPPLFGDGLFRFRDSEPAIDSLKMRIPAHLVTVKDPALEGDWLKVHETTGEVDEGMRWKNQVVHQGKGYRVRYQFEDMNLGGRKPERFLTMSLHAKILEERYLDGIGADTADRLLDAVLSHGKVSFSADAFFDKSECTDIDFKQDATFGDAASTVIPGDQQTVRDIDGMYLDGFGKALTDLSRMVKPSKFSGRGCRIFRQRENMGIQFAERTTTSFRKNPYLKIYHKGLEIAYRSPEFAETFLAGQDVKNLVRVEATLKNKKHIRHLWGHEASSLSALIALPKEDKDQVFRHAFDCHFSGATPPRPKMNVDDLKGNDLILLQAITMLMKGRQPWEWEGIREQMLERFESRKAKSNHRIKLNRIYSLSSTLNFNVWHQLTDVISWSMAKRA